MKALSISVDYDACAAEAVRMEVDLDGEPVLFGSWDVGIQWRGKTLKPVGSWTEVCEYKENGCDYLELDLPLTHDYRLQRFFLLDHEDRLLILADTILAGNDSKRSKRIDNLHYEATLPYSPKLTPKTGDAADMLFQWRSSRSERPLFRVLPPALPDTASDSGRMADGSLETADDALLYRLQSPGISLFAPLVFDFDAARLKKPFLRRHLTVGENLEKVPEDKAVGFRIQLGKDQFLIYRSMTEPANRTVMGHNLIDDFCFARFDPDTGVEPLVEVQQDGE